MLHECLANTSAHAVPHLVNNRNSPLSKLVWLLVILSSVALFAFHSSSLIDKFVQHDTSVSLSLDGANFTLPDVYICNNRPFSNMLTGKLALNQDPIFVNITNYLYEGAGVILRLNRYLPQYSREMMMNLLSNRNYTDFLYSIMVEYDDMVAPSRMFRQVVNSYHNFCYKLVDEYKPLLFKENTFELVLYTDEYFFPPANLNIHLTRSMKPKFSHTVYFTMPGYAPHAGSARIHVEGGMETAIEVTMDYFEKLNRGERPCREHISNVFMIHDWNLSVTPNTSSYYADAFSCAVTKLHRYWMRNCNCSFAMHPLDQTLWKTGRISVCTIINSKSMEAACLNPSMEEIKDFLPQCVGENPCNIPVYDTTFRSTALLNSEIKRYAAKYLAISPALYKDLASGKLKASGPLPDRFVNSFAKISIYAPKRTCNLWREFLSYDYKDLLSDIGGILGFYMGISLVTILEIFGYLVRDMSICRTKSSDIQL